MTSEQMEAGAALMHIRGEVCKALRKDADWAEVRVLLLAEAKAKQVLASCLEIK